MKYSVDIDRSVDALAYCLRLVQDGIDDIYDWDIRINAGGIDYGIYFNFDTDEKVLEISNQAELGANTNLYLEEIIDAINTESDEEE